MYRKIKTRNIILPIALISVLWLSCQKHEEPPIPVGKAIKYSGQILSSIDSALQKSPYTLFYAAWKKSGIDSLALNAANLTIYVPTDSAFTAAGYTASKISSLSKAVLDSLVAFHMVYGTYVDSTLASLQGSTEANTLLSTPNPPMSAPNNQGYPYSTQYPYVYSLFISGNNGFWINGLMVKTNNKLIHAYRAIIYPVNHVLQKPVKDVLGTLRHDPRFTYLFESYRLSDSIYQANYSYYAGRDTGFLALSSAANITFFAPTNDAFIKYLAGIYNKQISAVTFQDLKNYQNRGYLYYDLSPMDSLMEGPLTNTPYQINTVQVNLNGRNIEPFLNPNRPLTTGSTWLYNDLLYNAPALDGYLITPASSYSFAVIVDLDFIHTGTQVMVKRHSTNTAPPVNIIQHDIIATNGVIHVVDGLLPAPIPTFQY